MAIRRGPPVWPHITCVAYALEELSKQCANSCWAYRADDMKDLRCMSFTSKATSEILVAGMQNTMFVIDVSKGEIIKRVWRAPRIRVMYKWRLNSNRSLPRTTTSR